MGQRVRGRIISRDCHAVVTHKGLEQKAQHIQRGKDRVFAWRLPPSWRRLKHGEASANPCRECQRAHERRTPAHATYRSSTLSTRSWRAMKN